MRRISFFFALTVSVEAVDCSSEICEVASITRPRSAVGRALISRIDYRLRKPPAVIQVTSQFAVLLFFFVVGTLELSFQLVIRAVQIASVPTRLLAALQRGCNLFKESNFGRGKFSRRSFLS